MESIFGPIFEVIGQVLAFLYDLVPNLGVGIILLTCLIMLILYPLTAKQAKSMIAMQRVQPEIKKLQQKYKGDRQKLNEEMMKFYQENKINPLAGCLPLLVQLPIFVSLFNVLREPEKWVPKDSSLYASLCDGAKCAAGKVNPQYFLGLNLEKSATDVNGFLNAAPYYLLVGLVAVTGFLSVRQAQKRTPAANKQMGMVMRVLPIVFTVISISFPAGLVLYFVVSNLWRFGQQEIIFRRHGSANGPPPKERRQVGGGARTEVIDADSREVAAGNGSESGNGTDPSAPKGVQPAKRKTPAAQPAAEDEDAAAEGEPEGPDAGSEPRTGGLRSMFGLAPPAEPSNGGSGSKARSSSGSRGGGTQPRPPQQRKRNKKKRKR